MRILLPALSFRESSLNPWVCLCVHIHVLASCTCGFSLDSQQATFCFLCHSPQHLAHCIHRLAGWLNPQACKGREQSFRNPQRHFTENKYNQGGSSSLAGEVTPFVGFPHPLREKGLACLAPANLGNGGGHVPQTLSATIHLPY